MLAMNVVTILWIPECRQSLIEDYGPLESRLHRIVDRPSAPGRGPAVSLSLPADFHKATIVSLTESLTRFLSTYAVLVCVCMCKTQSAKQV